jgi:exodeoxyribonuclease V alpha subunit
VKIAMKPQPESSTQEVLAGLIERVTYHNAENGFCVLRAKARGHRDVVEFGFKILKLKKKNP